MNAIHNIPRSRTIRHIIIRFIHPSKTNTILKRTFVAHEHVLQTGGSIVALRFARCEGGVIAFQVVAAGLRVYPTFAYAAEVGGDVFEEVFEEERTLFT